MWTDGGRPEYRHKERAVIKAANELRAALNQQALAAATLVPIPPSASRHDPLYDDRITQIIRRVAFGINNPDIRELIVTRQSVAPAHQQLNARPSIDEILANYEIDEELVEPVPNSIVLFDDVLTAGAHFKACQRLLSERFSGVPITGVFIARRIFPAQGEL